MGDRYKRLIIKAFLIFGLAAVILLPAVSPESEARKPIRWRAKKVVVVDPGHGGNEIGAKGPGGVLEKDVTLELSRRIEARLKARFKVQLTRTDDYGLGIIGRTDVANHLEADVFVSIHAGGSFGHNARGMDVFFFRESRSTVAERTPTEKSNWDRLQLPHVKQSQILADSLHNSIHQAVPAIDCQVDSAPLLVLRGADMPSVLIEVGRLTSADEEKRLNSEEHLKLLSQAIADGINAFLRKLDAGSDR